MVIQIERDVETDEILGANFPTDKECDACIQEWRRRLREKAHKMRITDIERVKRRYGEKIMDQIFEEYLQRKIAIEEV
jgi:hypothetical protein